MQSGSLNAIPPRPPWGRRGATIPPRPPWDHGGTVILAMTFAWSQELRNPPTTSTGSRRHRDLAEVAQQSREVVTSNVSPPWPRKSRHEIMTISTTSWRSPRDHDNLRDPTDPWCRCWCRCRTASGTINFAVTPDTGWDLNHDLMNIKVKVHMKGIIKWFAESMMFVVFGL